MPRRVEPVCLVALTPQQAALAVGLNVSHIYRAIDRRELPCRMYAGSKRRRKVLVNDLIEWIESWPETPT